MYFPKEPFHQNAPMCCSSGGQGHSSRTDNIATVCDSGIETEEKFPPVQKDIFFMQDGHEFNESSEHKYS